MMNFKKFLVFVVLGFHCWVGAACAQEKETEPPVMGFGIFKEASAWFSPTLIFSKTSSTQPDFLFDEEHSYRFFWIEEKALSDTEKALQEQQSKWGPCPPFEERLKADAFRVRWIVAKDNGQFCVPSKDAAALFAALNASPAAASNQKFDVWTNETIEAFKSMPQ